MINYTINFDAVDINYYMFDVLFMKCSWECGSPIVKEKTKQTSF